MKIKVFFVTIITLMTVLYSGDARSQDTSLVIGNKIIKQKINYYDFSDPLKINFEVIVWGGFRNPGKYIVPEGTTVIDLITYAGVPINSDLLESIKLIRTKEISTKFSTSNVIQLNFKKFFLKENLNFGIENPKINPGDILITQIEPEMGFWDYVKEGILILGPLASIASLIVTLSK